MNYILAFIFVLGINTVDAQVIDTSFADNGIVPYGGPLSNGVSNQHRGRVMEIQDDGKLVVGTSNDDPNNNTWYLYTYRYMPNGLPDTTFGVNGVSELYLGDDSFYNDLKIQDDGKIVMIGESEYCTGGICGANQFIMLRFLPNGDLDSTFGTNGEVLTDDIFGSTATFCYPYGLEILDNGQFYVAGRDLNANPFIAKLNSDGSKDLSFGNNGIFSDTNCAYCNVKDLLVDDNENPLILVERWPTGGGNSEVRILKTDATGDLDANFGTNGIVDYTVTNTVWPKSFDWMGNDLIVVGNTEYQGFCSKVKSDGTIDTQFQSGTALHSTQDDSVLVFKKVQVVDEYNILVSGYILNFEAGQYLYEGIVGLLDEEGNWSPGFNQTGYMHLDYGSQATTGWTGKFTEPFDMDFTSSNEIFITGKRNPIPGNTKRTLFLAKLKDVEYNLPPDLSVDTEYQENLIVYPNPVSDILYLKQAVDVVVYDLRGKKVLSQLSAQKIDVRDLQSGIYVLHTSSGQMIKFVKQL